MKPGPTLQCGPVVRYSVDLRIQTYTEPVPLKYGKLATIYPSLDIRIFLQCSRIVDIKMRIFLKGKIRFKTLNNCGLYGKDFLCSLGYKLKFLSY